MLDIQVLPPVRPPGTHFVQEAVTLLCPDQENTLCIGYFFPLRASLLQPTRHGPHLQRVIIELVECETRGDRFDFEFVFCNSELQRRVERVQRKYPWSVVLYGSIGQHACRRTRHLQVHHTYMCKCTLGVHQMNERTVWHAIFYYMNIR